jgi:glutamine transport system permease protein
MVPNQNEPQPSKGNGPTESRLKQPTWASRARGAALASAPTALIAGIVILTAIALIGTLAFVGVIDGVFILQRWSTAYLPFWTAPLWNSVFLTISSFVLGFAIAITLGVVRAYGVGKTRNRIAFIFYAPVTGYVHAIRGTPFFVQLWLVFFAVLAVAPQVNILGWDVYLWAGLLALTLNTVGYQAEVFRGGFQAVGQGQIEAAKAVGLKGPQIFLHITLPQALRLITLPLTNEFIALFKASTIASYVSVYELFVWAENLGVKFGHPVEGFLMISLYYLIITIPLSRGVSYLERRRRIPGLGTQPGGESFTLRFLGRTDETRRLTMWSRGQPSRVRSGVRQPGHGFAQVSTGSRGRFVPAGRQRPRDTHDDLPISGGFHATAAAAKRGPPAS